MNIVLRTYVHPESVPTALENRQKSQWKGVVYPYMIAVVSDRASGWQSPEHIAHINHSLEYTVNLQNELIKVPINTSSCCIRLYQNVETL